VDGVLIAVGTEFLQLNAIGRITTVFLGGVARYTVRALVRISPALCAFKGYDEAYAFSHDRSPGDNAGKKLKHSLSLFHSFCQIAKIDFWVSPVG
jgi:hypothetical protein